MRLLLHWVEKAITISHIIWKIDLSLVIVGMQGENDLAYYLEES